MKTYSLWSNYRYAYAPLWREKREILMYTACNAVFFVFVPVMGMMATSMIIGSLEQKIPAGQLFCRILLAFACYGVLNMIKGYLEARDDPQYVEARLGLFVMQQIDKDLTISMEQYEDDEVHCLKEKAYRCLWSNLDGLEGFFHDNSALLKNGLGLLAYSLIVGVMDGRILLMLIGMSAFSAFVSYSVTRYHHKIKDALARQDMTMQYIDRIVDDVQGGKDIRIFGLCRWLIGKYDAAIRNKRRILFGKDIREYGSNILDIVLDALRDMVCYLYLILQLSRGMRISEFVFYLGLIGGFSGWIAMISKNVVAVKRDSDMICDLRAYLDNEDDRFARNGVSCADWQDIEIEFDHVSYRYKGAAKDTLKDVSFRIAAGEKVALVGMNGAGKTTIVKLMSGLYLPTSGTVYVNGISTRELDIASYHARQAAVFQELFQTAYSIGENVAFEEAYDAQKVWNALFQAGLGEKIKASEHQLGTHLGKDIAEDGILLSGGEMQKLLLARALYRDAALVLLDEPTAAMDALAETEIYEKYERLFKEKTVLFISHRLASTRSCDRILLIADGQICEEGSHAQLMAAHGRYHEMFQVQSRYYDR